jgi:hypothetical protein
MAGEVKRWNLKCGWYDHDPWFMDESTIGLYVLHTDYAALASELAALVNAVRKIRRSDFPDREEPLWQELQAALSAADGGTR